jgi:NAD(P)-dependent dehydrogenase (short-subunit alcohol dehydrogenase family)
LTVRKVTKHQPAFLDVTRKDSIEHAYKEVHTRTAELDAIVHLAGMSAFASLIGADAIDTLERIVEVNLLGMARVNGHFFPLLRVPGGRIVHCSSEAGWMTAQPFAGAYYLSKHAVEAYSDSLRRELMFQRISVVVLQPGPFQTRMTDAVRRGFEKARQDNPLYARILTRLRPMMELEFKRTGDPAAFARLVLRVLESRHPRIRYRVGTSWRLALLERLPDGLIDRIYLFLGTRGHRRHRE